MLFYIDDLGVDFSKALLKNPSLRSASVDSVKAVERCLSSMGIERSAFGRILDMYPQLLTSDPFRDLYPVFDFLLNDVGIPYHSIRRSIIRCPRLLVCSVDHQLRPALRFLRVLGFVGRKAITFRTTMLLVSSVRGTLAPKIEYLEGLGFGHGQVAKMVLRSPGLLTYSIRRNLLPKVEYFTREMKGDVKELKRFPQYFSFSLDGRIRPRHRILEEHGLVLPLSDMLKISDAEFKVRLLELQL